LDIPVIELGDVVYVEQVSLEEQQQEEDISLLLPRKTQVVHFSKTTQSIHYFGNPFYIILNSNEDEIEKIKSKILSKLVVGKEEFNKWKFCLLSPMKSIIYPSTTNNEKITSLIAWESLDWFIGLEHNSPSESSKWSKKGITIKG